MLRIYSSCNEERPLEGFYRDGRAKDGLHSYCKTCISHRAAERYRRRKLGLPGLRPSSNVPQGHKRCPACSGVKPTGDFPRNRSTRDGRGSYCKPCHNAKTKATYTRLYGSSRHYHLLRRYGVGSAEVEALISAQAGLCAICREGRAEHVDHEHLTGRVRGVLCFNCNGGLGQFRDRPEVLKRAITYLEEHAWRTLVAPGAYRLSS